MKKIMIALVLCTLTLLAHPPGSVELEFDSESKLLNVLVPHSVNDASRHYITKLIVDLNGKKVVEQKFRSQTDDGEQRVLYTIHDATEGDKIKVTAFCNISGKRSSEITVTVTEEE
jgi:desulfoferrodoxin (superoxide reductase-like protein)